jgi:hypothetical protein
MKFLIFCGILVFTPVSIFAQVLTELPFGIVIGETKNSEIENRGVCIKQIQVRENHFRCERYSMAGGRFKVESSQDEMVSKVYFVGLGSLPKNWRDLGLNIDYYPWADVYIENPKNTLLDDFRDIIRSQGVDNIEIIEKRETYSGGLRKAIIGVGEIHFELGKNTTI